MSSYINSIKSKLIMAVDLEQKRINNLNSLLDVYKQLDSFPMTLDILNKSRIGKFVNDIRHFDNIESDIKKKLKNLIKKWNGLLPSNNSRSSSVSDTKHVESNRNGHHSIKNDNGLKSASNPNLVCLNGVGNKSKKRTLDAIKDSLDYDIPTKVRKSNTNASINESPLIRFNMDENSTDSHMSDIKYFHHQNKDDTKNHSNSKEKRHSRKEPTNGVVATPLPKVKSTKELLAGFGDFIGSDTRKRILCDEILPEDDIPKSCLPESVRPRSKILKSSKPSLAHDYVTKQIKNSPKPPHLSSLTDESSDSKLITANKNDFINNRSCDKTANINNIHNIDCSKVDSSPKSDKNRRKRPRQSSNVNSSTNQINIKEEKPPVVMEDPMKFKIKNPKHKSHKKKHKHHNIDPPITNRMNDISILPDISQIEIDLSQYEYSTEPKNTELSDLDIQQLSEKLAHSTWVNHNCTYNNQTNDHVDYNSSYYHDHLVVLPWTDIVYYPNVFLVDDYQQTFEYLESQITMAS